MIWLINIDFILTSQFLSILLKMFRIVGCFIKIFSLSVRDFQEETLTVSASLELSIASCPLLLIKGKKKNPAKKVLLVQKLKGFFFQFFYFASVKQMNKQTDENTADTQTSLIEAFNVTQNADCRKEYYILLGYERTHQREPLFLLEF